MILALIIALPFMGALLPCSPSVAAAPCARRPPAWRR